MDILIYTGAGCYLKLVFLSILLYADDMALLAPLLKGLQTLLTTTEQYCKKVGYNAEREKIQEYVLRKKI